MNKNKIYKFLLLALLGAVVATLCDAHHVFTQTLSYPKPVFFDQAWWVFPGFFIAFYGMNVGYELLLKICRGRMTIVQSRSHGSVELMNESMVLFVAIYLISGFGNEYPVYLAWLFYGTFALRLLTTYERGFTLMLASALAIGGMFVEGLLAEIGEVQYRHTDIFNVPYWLGGLYMHGALALRESMRAMVYIKR